MRNIRIKLAYDGMDFRGWQIQPGQPTIQGALTEVIERLTQCRPTIHGAGRTDAGVHAAGQVANFQTESAMTAGEFQHALNSLLPPSIRILASEEVAPEFHARWNAVAKTYRYRIFRGHIVPPFLYRYVQHDPYALDFAAMAVAARKFEGEHDFTTFAASTGSDEDDRERITTRTIYRSELLRTGEGNSLVGDEEWVYIVRGKSFLRYMVRKIVGTLMDVGRGKIAPEEIPNLFEMRDRSRSGPTMPPQGLCMEEVEYAGPAISLVRKDDRSQTNCT
jgi:tRNA pseudouridine38-40 synthase